MSIQEYILLKIFILEKDNGRTSGLYSKYN